MRIGVLTSGGDAPGMNAALRAVVRVAIYEGHDVVGIRNGFSGIFEKDFVAMGLSSVADIIHKGGTILGTSRSKEMRTDEGIARAREILKEEGVEHLIVIGGDGSMKGALALSDAGQSVITLPATIDNDLGYQEASIGFYTAVETILEAVGRIRDTSSALRRANIIEVMGRHCGDLALYAGIAGGAESVIIPEVPFDFDGVKNKILAGKKRGKRHHIILLTEEQIPAYGLAKDLEEATGVETRVTILGYTQRGGIPTGKDRINASRLGAEAVFLCGEEKRSLALGLSEGKIKSFDLREALAVEKTFDRALYDTLDKISI
ncbi:putative 6-phosphofructokinase [Aedoeadaptatus coxii]|uniref:6-phosphofructokinase n=1 Tax=Aedoeadaptatus coxii TaxID=755172 RepID=A0A134ALC5_9FIRM|nr:ATP-dependent 6-phosphofructokinase [Peptoniphilus coxii]KXB68459.1 putative 6-phosphofructokinase [Peptoniphilus coxii]CAC9926214.1 putative 6-phosphofructokinase [Peptoniphilus coxii]